MPEMLIMPERLIMDLALQHLARKMHRLGLISYKVLIFYGIKFATQISAVFAEPHWPAQPAMIGYTL
jgi:hypothetical protein